MVISHISTLKTKLMAAKLATDAGLLEEEPELHKSKMADIPQLVVPRPIHTAMEPGRLVKELGWAMRSWEEAARFQIRAMATGECH